MYMLSMFSPDAVRELVEFPIKVSLMYYRIYKYPNGMDAGGKWTGIS